MKSVPIAPAIPTIIAAAISKATRPTNSRIRGRLNFKMIPPIKRRLILTNRPLFLYRPHNFLKSVLHNRRCSLHTDILCDGGAASPHLAGNCREIAVFRV